MLHNLFLEHVLQTLIGPWYIGDELAFCDSLPRLIEDEDLVDGPFVGRVRGGEKGFVVLFYCEGLEGGKEVVCQIGYEKGGLVLNR